MQQAVYRVLGLPCVLVAGVPIADEPGNGVRALAAGERASAGDARNGDPRPEPAGAVGAGSEAGVGTPQDRGAGRVRSRCGTGKEWWRREGVGGAPA